MSLARRSIVGMTTLWNDYRATFDGELECGAPDTLRTRWGAFYYAARRAWWRLIGSRQQD